MGSGLGRLADVALAFMMVISSVRGDLLIAAYMAVLGTAAEGQTIWSRHARAGSPVESALPAARPGGKAARSCATSESQARESGPGPALLAQGLGPGPVWLQALLIWRLVDWRPQAFFGNPPRLPAQGVS